MAFRNNNRNNRFDRGNFGGPGGRNVNPWGDNSGSGGRGGNMMNQNSQGGHLNSDTLSLANNLITNLLRNQGGSSVPPLMDMPPSFGRGYGNGPNRGYDDFNRFDDRLGRGVSFCLILLFNYLIGKQMYKKKLNLKKRLQSLIRNFDKKKIRHFLVSRFSLILLHFELKTSSKRKDVRIFKKKN